MRWNWVLATLLVAAVAGKKKHRHHKPGRALLDRLSSTTVGEVIVTKGAETGELIPAPLDVAPHSQVEANATCGQEGAEEYCRDTPGKRGVVCDVCEGAGGSSSRRHPPSYAVDGDPSTWWQSPTFAAGDFQNVDLIATLPDKMELLHVIIKSGPSPRPLAWSLEVSSSEYGDDWRLVRAFGDREHCKRLWDLRPERRRRKARAVKRMHRADKATCSTQFSSPRPLENGEMHVGIGEGVSARRVRVSFRAAHPAPPLQQYYTVRALTLAARCLCHGHAQECQVFAEGAKCTCLHNTCGSHCQRCCNGSPWKPHEPCSAETSDQCSCGERGACSYDDTGAILCVNCTENRAGPLCDRCLIGFYNDVSDGPCLPCNCDSDGSDGSCTWDKKLHQVSCNCRPGFTGPLCDSCEDPLASFPTCHIVETTTLACKCDPRGIVDSTRVCDEVCECKANVVGERCDTCAPGHFGLSETLTEGCRRCYCSHVTDSCVTADTAQQDEIPASMVLPLGEGWSVTDADQNQTYDPSLDDQGKLYLVSYEVEDWESFYWLTTALNGDQLSAYGSELVASVFWGIVRGDTGGNPTVGPDVILLAADGTKLAHGNRSYETPGQMELVVPLVEGDWYRESDDGTPVSRVQLMDVLRDLKAMMIRAHFHGDQDEVRLESVELRATSVPLEQCSCPVGYSGAHCSRCAWTHARVQHAAGEEPRFECVTCDCNGHATCDTVNGPCGPCQHNTTGPHCERCLPGHYGNPVQGSCSPCACPLYLPSNNFSPNCALASAEGDGFVCTQCPDGYTGDHCEHCDYGYWGSPTTPGSSCQPCACGGAPCHPATGLCITCPPHTEGARCDQCQVSHWGSPSTPGSSCQPCHPATGLCITCPPHTEGARCDQCQVSHWGSPSTPGSSCQPCHPATGLCITCPPHTEGARCDQCQVSHWGSPSTPGSSCQPCHPATGLCITCPPHTEGARCDQCQVSHWGSPSTPGSSCQPCHPATGLCITCPPHTEGARCDQCQVSHWGSPSTPGSSCQPCHPATGLCITCPPHTEGARCDQCQVSHWGSPSTPGSSCQPCHPATGLCITCPPHTEGARCDQCQVSHWGSPSTPGSSCQPCHPATGLCITCPPHTEGARCDQCQVSHWGSPSTPGSSCQPCHPATGLCITCPPHTEGARCDQCQVSHWGSPSTPGSSCQPCHPATGLCITCPPHTEGARCDQCQVSHWGSPSTPGSSCQPRHPATGLCITCPPHTEGARCDQCQVSHWGSPSTPGSSCQPCHPATGLCITCPPHTEGARCDQCQVSHWGSPSTPGSSCQPCHPATGLCITCPPHTEGARCDQCQVSHWGSPSTPGSSCQPCHPATGLCITCPPHTEGARCDQCQEGYWFGPDGYTGSGSSCIPCECGRGALSVACDARSGQCACKEGWGGVKCDACGVGHGGIEAGCPSCRCGLASLDTTCDAIYGACVCAPGAAPPHCDSCLPDYYGVDVSGCKGCNCSILGAESNACDIRSGQCRCKPHVTGRACDTCKEGYWGLHQGGCRRCACGAGAAACDPVTGACACAPGVGGAHCDVCMPGYYGFGPAGCLPCPVCTDGKVCSPETGRCVCPARSHGPGCKQCAPGYTARSGSCQHCNCGPGAVSNTCDPITGQCKCRTGWSGLDCNTCAPGHFGPRCRPCDCSIAGTRDCVNGTCSCDEHGRCPCKENVVGDKCDRCLEGTFGLSADNPTGCTACFCFGRTAHCTQASVTRAALHAAAPVHLTLLLGDTVTSMDQESLLSIHTHSPDVTISLPWPPVPVYMELDKRFLGDRVTSYGGALRFRVEEEGGQELPAETRARFPLVRLYGRHIVLDYHERIPPVNGTHSVRFHESLWTVRTRRPGGAVASRSALMLALQQLDRIMLRVTTRAPTYDDHVHALLLNVSLDTAIPGLSRSEPALGVEMCDCPRGYSAGSCQKPAIGFWIPPQKVHLSNVAGTIVISLEGDAQPCHCNGRALACDAVTGDCLNCTSGTGGPRCAVCAEGYHGSPDAPGGCQACPCPSRTKNFASACVMNGHYLQCLCKPGYTGRECESCALGYMRSPDGSCVPCGCDPAGAVVPHCDNRGRCRCRPFATGIKCDQCVAKRTYMDADGCIVCDNCTQTLLDSIEALTSDLKRRADLNELSRIPSPFPALREYEYNTTRLRNEYHNLKKRIEHSRNVEPLIEELQEFEHRVLTEAYRLKTEASRREKEANSLSLESMSGLEEVLKQKRILGEQVGALDDFARGERHLSAHRALKEARHLLRQIKEMKLIDYYAGANDVFDVANRQSTSVQEYNYRLEDSSRKLNQLRNKLDNWQNKSEDVTRLADKVWTAGDTIANLAVRVRPKLGVVRDTALRCRLVLEDITNLSPENLTEDIHSDLLRAQNLGRGFPSLVAELKALTMAAEEKEGILYNLTPTYREKYLTAVEKHVAMLAKKAKEYKSLFAGTRAVASAGVTAARAWTEVAETVRNASEAANIAASAANVAVKMARGSEPMTNTAKVAKVASEEIKKRAAAALARAEELRTQLDHLRRGADLVSVMLRGLGWQERDLGLRPKADVAAVLATANEQADRVFATTRVLYDEASEFRRRVRYNLRRQLAELQRHGDTALGAAQEHVSQIRGNTVRGAEVAEALAAAAAARAREHEVAKTTLSPAILALQDKIARARHAADSISVSLTSVSGAPVGCARSYPLHVSSPAVTKVAIAVSFDGHVRDGPLLYLLDNTQETENYIKLSVENKKLKLTWDLGGGEGLILHPEELQAAHDDGDHTSYRLDIERIWNTVHLTVKRAGGTPITATNSTSISAVTLRTTQLWLGHPGDVTGLPGCVHALYSDDKTIGLWNFVQQPKEAKCTGCTQRWYMSARGGETLVWFNGAGYAELRRSGLRPSDRRQFSLAFTFRTRDEDALLFMAVDAANNRSVSVVLRACRVVFVVQYLGAALEVAAGGRHCHGRPAHVQAIRVFADNRLERGSLRVNGEETLGSPLPPVQSAAALPDLSTATYWLGGAPPGGNAPAPPLLGCLGGVTIDREGYDLLDTPTRHGVEARCDGSRTRTLRSATLEGSGYIELASPLFRRKAALGLSFRARAPSGLLLFRTPSINQDNEVDDEDDGDDRHYLVLVMTEGELEVIAAAGKAETRLRTNGTRYNDGRLHTVRIVRAHKQLELWVDEERVASGTLAGNAYPARATGTFLGGVDHWDSTRMPEISTEGFTGTIADFIVDSSLIGLESALNWSGARLGRADSELRADTRTEPRALQAQPGDASGCTKTSSYTVEAGAVKFGDAPGSHAVLKLPPKIKELAISLQFRTFASEGILLFSPGAKSKPKHYLALILKEGKLNLIVRGRKRRQVALAAFVADGTWRSVQIRVSRTRLILSSAGAAATAHAPGTARAPRLYIGGYPAPPANPHTPNAILRLGGFRGCVRRVMVNGRAEDLVRDAQAHHRVGQCFPNIEQGAYFSGDSYAAWSGALGGVAGGSLELRAQFRSAAPHGLLLAAPAFALELRDGTLVLTRQSSSGTETSRTETRGVGGRALCDNSWHTVTARISRASLSLSLDGGPELKGVATGTLLDDDADSPLVVTPLYIGGLPEGTIESPDSMRENFKGCIRDVWGAQLLQWTHMETLHNVLLDSCPTA